MAEALIRAVNQVSLDPYKDVKLTKAGYVLLVNPDGFSWSTAERTLDIWRIVAVPGIPVSDLDDFLFSESGYLRRANASDPLADERTNPMLQLRAVVFDLTKLPVNIATILAAPRTGNGILVASGLQVANLKKILPKVANPNILG